MSDQLPMFNSDASVQTGQNRITECPECGFSHSWNGESCTLCNYKVPSEQPPTTAIVGITALVVLSIVGVLWLGSLTLYKPASYRGPLTEFDGTVYWEKSRPHFLPIRSVTYRRTWVVSRDKLQTPDGVELRWRDIAALEFFCHSDINVSNANSTRTTIRHLNVRLMDGKIRAFPMDGSDRSFPGGSQARVDSDDASYETPWPAEDKRLEERNRKAWTTAVSESAPHVRMSLSRSCTWHYTNKTHSRKVEEILHAPNDESTQSGSFRANER